MTFLFIKGGRGIERSHHMKEHLQKGGEIIYYIKHNY